MRRRRSSPTFAQVSDRGSLGSGIKLSDIPIFPNNHEDFAVENYSAYKFRESFRDATEHRSKWEELEKENHELLGKNENLLRENGSFRNSLEEFRQTTNRQKAEIAQLSGETKAAERSNRSLRWTLWLTFLLSLVICALLVAEALWLRDALIS